MNLLNFKKLKVKMYLVFTNFNHKNKFNKLLLINLLKFKT